jgi:hypothetical protein
LEEPRLGGAFAMEDDMKKVGMPVFKKGPSEKPENRVAHALEYIAQVLEVQTEIMVQQHNAAVDAKLMEGIKKSAR